jgi:hypothetical protein
MQDFFTRGGGSNTHDAERSTQSQCISSMSYQIDAYLCPPHRESHILIHKIISAISLNHL